MDYFNLDLKEFFSCKIKYSYIDIYILSQIEYIKVLRIKKSDFSDIIGYGEATYSVDNLVPITLTENAVNFILSKYAGVGVVTNYKNDVFVDQEDQKWIEQGENPFYVAPENINPDDVYRPDNNDSLTQDVIEYISNVGVVFVLENKIVCEPIPEDDVTVEDVELPSDEEDEPSDEEDEPSDEVVEKKKNINWIWLAAAAAAALLL